ncbi:MAG: hypothetical protein JW808_01560 [Victivallales bacterium]|nr:hypothetical protein [Victivallales bacterium]
MQRMIAVVGSSNLDMTTIAPRLPLPGGTVGGGAFMTAGGGKGANQAVAAARLSSGAGVALVACIGSDDFGDNMIKAFKVEGIVTDFIFREEAASGVAAITVSAENCIVVCPGTAPVAVPQPQSSGQQTVLSRMPRI